MIFITEIGIKFICENKTDTCSFKRVIESPEEASKFLGLLTHITCSTKFSYALKICDTIQNNDNILVSKFWIISYSINNLLYEICNSLSINILVGFKFSRHIFFCYGFNCLILLVGSITLKSRCFENIYFSNINSNIFKKFS